MAIGIGTENPDHIVTREAGTNVTKHRFVKEAAGGIVNRCDTAGEKVAGVAGSTVTAGDGVDVKKGGTVIVEAGAVVADLAEVMTDTVGRAITATAVGKKVARVANGTSAGAAGDLLVVELFEEAIEDVKALTPGLGAALTSAATIAPTNTVHHVTGTAEVTTITAPTGLKSGDTVTLIPDGAFTTATGGNIAKASTGVVDKALIMTWDATAAKWYPSY